MERETIIATAPAFKRRSKLDFGPILTPNSPRSSQIRLCNLRKLAGLRNLHKSNLRCVPSKVTLLNLEKKQIW